MNTIIETGIKNSLFVVMIPLFLIGCGGSSEISSTHSPSHPSSSHPAPPHSPPASKGSSSLNSEQSLPQKREWLLLPEGAIEIAAAYYSKPYPHDPDGRDHVAKRTIRGTEVKVYRPNHGLAHGARKAGLSYDLLNVLHESTHTTPLKLWLDATLKKDADFRLKLAFAALLLRAGRSSELHLAPGQILGVRSYDEDCYESARIFYEEAQKVSIFTGSAEILTFRRAIEAMINPGALTPGDDDYFINHLLWAVHFLDWSRLAISLRDFQYKPGEPTRTKNQVADYLELPHGCSEVERLWNRSIEYLEATGDLRGNLKPPRPVPFHQDQVIYSEDFYILSNSPHQLLHVIETHSQTPLR